MEGSGFWVSAYMQQSSYRLFLRDTMASPSSAVFARFTGLIEFCVDKSPATNEVREFMKVCDPECILLAVSKFD